MINSLEHFAIELIAFKRSSLRDVFPLTTEVTLFCLSLLLILMSIIYAADVRFASSWSVSDYLAIKIYWPILRLIKVYIPGRRSLRYFTLIFFTFFFVLSLNLFSLAPHAVAITSHLIFTLFFALTLFLGVIIIGILTLRARFISLFYPLGIHYILSNILVILEVTSFLIRPFSLAVRLFANMLAGHILLGIFSSIAFISYNNFIILGLVSFPLCVAIIGLELGVSFIQAYVFIVLFMIYISDVTKLKH